MTRALAVVAAVAAAAAVGAWQWPARGEPTSAAARSGAGRALPAIAHPDDQQFVPTTPLERHMLDRATVRARAGFTAPDGSRFTVAEARSYDGSRTCVVSTGPKFSGADCADSGFADSPIVFVESFSGNPDAGPVREWELAGLAAPQVARLVLVDSSGKRWHVAFANGAFFFAFPHGDLATGVNAQELDVYARDGSVLREEGL